MDMGSMTVGALVSAVKLSVDPTEELAGPNKAQTMQVTILF